MVNSNGKKFTSQDIYIIPNNFADSDDENKYSLQSSLSTPMHVDKLVNNPFVRIRTEYETAGGGPGRSEKSGRA